MNKEFVMRGQTASGGTEVLNFSGYKPGYAYRLVEFQLYPSTNIGTDTYEFTGIINAGKTTAAPTDPNFNDEGCIGTTLNVDNRGDADPGWIDSVINDTFLITQNLILMVQDTGGNNHPANWQCRFVAEKMSGPEEAVANYKQFQISDGS
jgi:hypothetical protein